MYAKSRSGVNRPGNQMGPILETTRETIASEKQQDKCAILWSSKSLDSSQCFILLICGIFPLAMISVFFI
ncbi:hypothetical protein AMEX_G6189 [Astyanax mexicanus]|uniref:Uncharacterized protein n=1 Tax=Astyanax mexicanus TaxID=7994 RepID=A0A8T2M2U7_ASTMX|nr:hypothetical protein AMEX_G6189 [Astyanax mexicanus]